MGCFDTNSLDPSKFFITFVPHVEISLEFTEISLEFTEIIGT